MESLSPWIVIVLVQVILVALPGLDTDKLEAEINKQLDELPRLQAVRSAFNHSCIVHAKDRREAAEFSNLWVLSALSHPSAIPANKPDLSKNNF